MSNIVYILHLSLLTSHDIFVIIFTMSDYFKQRDEMNLRKIDGLLADMPGFVEQFIVGISSQTSALTRLNYVTDIRIFFAYLI